MRSIFFWILFFLIKDPAAAQGADWEKDVPGKLVKAPASKISGLKMAQVFEVVNRVPAIASPKGFNVVEDYKIPVCAKICTGKMYISFYRYYSFDKGPVKLQDSHPKTISISFNDPEALMNFQSKLFPQEAMELGLPVMFTDTFPIRYENLNGTEVGHGIVTTFNSRLPLYVLNPARLSFFRPVTQEEYIRFFIGKLGMDIAKDAKQIEENKSSIREIAANPALAASLPEIQKAQAAMIKWVEFLRSKKQYYEKKLAGLSAAEKKEPAKYAMHKDMAVLMDSKGNYLDTISGHLPYEPAEAADALFTDPLFTFSAQPFDPKIPKAAFQLIVIEDAYSEGVDDPMRHFLQKEFYPLLSFKDIAALMLK